VNVPPEIVTMFRTSKLEYDKQHPLPGADRKPAPLRRLLPFGIGHMLEGKYGRGIVYISLSALALGLNISTYQERVGMKGPDGTYRDPAAAYDLQRIQVGAFYGGFLGVGLVSFIDAIVNN
jgi:hypothetical protein